MPETMQAEAASSVRADWVARLTLLRPANAVMAAAGTAAGMLVTRTGPLPLESWIAAPAAAALIASFGNVLNDRNDVALDRRAHPGRPLPSGRVSLDEARALAWLLAIAGLACAGLAGVAPMLLAAGNVALLALYESGLKAHGLAGNLLIGYLVASTFLFGAAATGQPPAAWNMAWVIAAMALLVNVGRELLKDLEDKDADAGFRRTFAMRQPAPIVRLVAFGAVAIAVALSLTPILRRPPTWSTAWLGLLAPADGILLLGAMAARRSVPYAQRMLKAGMAVALVAFAGAAWRT
ncbi:MAG: geranylgeranylglycerol-phosphate geranylgeranyltransferase [bacterium]